METRRDFMKLGALAALAAGARRASAANVDNSIPQPFAAQIADALERFNKWKGTDEVVSFTCVTDIHSRKLGINNNYGDSKMHIPLAQKCALAAGCDFFADLGDQDLEWACTSEENLATRMQNTVDLYKNFKIPFLMAMGNHDHGKKIKPTDKACPVSNERFGSAFNTLSARHGHKFTQGDDKSYGFYDVPGKRFRIFVLNSSDQFYYGYSAKQLQWLADNLANLPKGWHTAVLQHYCIFSPIGNWQSWKGDKAGNGDLFIKLLEDFVAHRKGAADGVKWDFTKLDDTHFAGFFCGDSHFDNQIEVNYVHYTIMQGYGGCSPFEIAYGARKHTFDRSKTVSFDIVAFKPAKLEARTFRVGAGAGEADRAYIYDLLKLKFG